MDGIKYAVGNASFPFIREHNRFYVDKTRYIYKMVSEGEFYFLSRPRRFGKSLLISTMECFFQGKKDLFKGLDIERFEKEWIEYPVLRLDLSSGEMSNNDNLLSVLKRYLLEWEKKYKLESVDESLTNRFYNIITHIYNRTGKRVVILIDEYDNPIFSTLSTPEEHEKIRKTLKGVYSVLKSAVDYIRFCFLTGITRFSKMSIFSGLNNLEDITLNPDYAGICGITNEEIKKYGSQGVEKVASFNNWTIEETRQQLKTYYDGYRFAAISPDVYNPYSLIQAFKTGDVYSYWFDSGPSEMLWKRIKEAGTHESIHTLLSPVLTRSQLGATEEEGFSLSALLFQTGYLTIKGTPQRNYYKLGIPNEEVREGIMHGLLPLMSKHSKDSLNTDIMQLRTFAEQMKVDEMMRFLKSFLSEISNRLTKKMPEIYFENNLLILFNLIGIETRAEVDTSYSRMDLYIRCATCVYIIELKLDKSAQVALTQIKEKEYALPFERKDLPIILLGINFSSEKRNITDWIWEKLK